LDEIAIVKQAASATPSFLAVHDVPAISATNMQPVCVRMVDDEYG
jgi:hypothetical protein